MTTSPLSNSAYYADMTWPEVAEAAAEDRVVIVPVGTVEQHGPHLPVDSDNRIAEAFCAAAHHHCADKTALIAPTVAFGLSRHLADFPGAVYHSTRVLIEVLTEVFSAYAQSGVFRILRQRSRLQHRTPRPRIKEALNGTRAISSRPVSWWEPPM